MLINLSNHPSSKWSEAQTQSAHQYGDIVDLPFPKVDPKGDETDVVNLAEEYFQKVLDLANGTNVTVHLMGEMTLTYALVQRLQKIGIVCVASTTQRVSIDLPDGRQESVFKFVKFRKYQ